MNDLAMAFLGAIFVVFGANLLSEGLYHSDVPEVAGYEIEGAPVEVETADAGETVIEDASMMMAKMDVSEGENVAKKCVSCHNFNEGGANKVGPVLWDVINREIASVADFGYSGALTAYAEGGKVWDYQEMNGFLYKPKEHVKGTSMGFAGLKKTDERAAIMAYMRSLSANPAPLPDPADAATPASAEGDVQPAETNEAETSDAVETPTQPEAATAEPVAPKVVSPEEKPVNTDAAPTADPGTAESPATTSEGATE